MDGWSEIGKSVKVVYGGKDRYGRIIGKVYLEAEYINLQMVAEGMAWHYKQFSNDKDLADAETEAREKKLGLWQDASPIPPWDWRKQEK